MVKLYLIRHGETELNKQGIVQGSGVDASLNELGRRQARAFYEYYRHLDFDAVYCSDLKRTIETLEPWEQAGYALIREPGIREVSWGILEGEKPSKEVIVDFRAMKQRWSQGLLDEKIEGGESPKEAWARAKPFFDRIRKEHIGEQLLVCSHGRISVIVLSELLGYGLARMHEFQHSNTGLNILYLYPNGKTVAEKLNDNTHIQELLHKETSNQ